MTKLITAQECLLWLYGNGYGDGNGDFQLPHPYYKVDGLWCEFLQIKGNYAKVKMVDMYNIDNCYEAYIAKHDGKFAHGQTLKEAHESLIYKIGDRDESKYNDWKLSDIKTAAELIEAYRVITGACELGTRHFCAGVKLPKQATVAEAIKITKGQHGSERFERFFLNKD